MKKVLLKKYAQLIARVGANIQKGQPVRLFVKPPPRYEPEREEPER